MTYHVQRVQRLRVYEEPNGSFATDKTADLASFTDIPMLEGSGTLALDQPTIDPMTVKQNMYDHNEEVLGPKRPKLGWEMNLGVPTTMAASGTTAAQTPAGLLLKLTMGGEQTSAGDSVAISGDQDTLALNAGHNKEVGSAIAWVNANSRLEVREISSISVNTLTMKINTSATAATNDVIYGCRTYFLDNHTSSDVTSLQAILEGLGESGDGFEDCWVVSGGQIEEPMTITFANGEIPKLGFNFTLADWDNGDDKGLTPAALGTATYTDHKEIIVMDSEFRCGTVGSPSLSGTEYHINEFNVQLGYKYTPLTSPGGTNNIVQWVMNPDRPVVQGTFTTSYEGQTFVDHKTNRTDLYIAFQIGSTVAGGAILISIPTIQITDVQRVDMGGLMGQQVSFKGRLDGDTTPSSALADSPFRIHIF